MYFILQLIGVINNTLPKPTFNTSLKSVLSATFGIVAILSVIFVAIGGLKYTLASGDPQNIKKAKDTILYAVIGLVISLSVFTIINFVAGSVG